MINIKLTHTLLVIQVEIDEIPSEHEDGPKSERQYRGAQRRGESAAESRDRCGVRGRPQTGGSRPGIAAESGTPLEPA
jgi:hypothetical protein